MPVCGYWSPIIDCVSQDSSVGGHSVAEMERVVAAMRKVVERLQGENESLRRSAKQRGFSVTHLETENRRLKACWRSSENCVFFPLCSLIVASSPGSLLHRGEPWERGYSFIPSSLGPKICSFATYIFIHPFFTFTFALSYTHSLPSLCA